MNTTRLDLDEKMCVFCSAYVDGKICWTCSDYSGVMLVEEAIKNYGLDITDGLERSF